MNQIWLQRLTIIRQRVFEVICQSIDQSAGEIAHSWMNHHTGCFVYYNYVIVLINNIQWNILGHNVIDIRRIWQ